MINSRALLLCLISFFLSSCVRVESSPMINFKNASANGEVIKNMQVVWNGYQLLRTSGPINVCDGGGSQNFNMSSESDLFGPVNIKWQNAKGKKVTKSFNFTRKDFPTFKRRMFEPYKHYSITLFFTQTNVEFYTSDHPNFRQIQEQKQGNWVNKWFEDEYTHKCVNDPKEAARIRAKAKKYSPISTTTGKPIFN